MVTGWTFLLTIGRKVLQPFWIIVELYTAPKIAWQSSKQLFKCLDFWPMQIDMTGPDVRIENEEAKETQFQANADSIV